jgi:uncharacterized protein
MRRRLRSLLKSTFLSSFFFVAALAAAQVAVPPLKARVTDLTGTLSSEQSSALEQTLAEFEKRKGAQIAVLMLPSTRPEEIEPFAVRVQEAWKLGRKGVDDGVLLVVAKDDRRLKIETGYGLEGVLPDAIAKRIIDQDIAPRFKQGDFYGGIRAGTDRMMRVIEGEALPPPAAGRAGESAQLSQHMDWIIPALILVMVVGGVLRSIFGRFIGSGLIGAVAGGLAWFIVGSLVIALLVALAAFVFQLAGGSGMRSGRRGWGGGFGGGGWSSGGGGGGFGGGGFGGGGGSSGGGGASGSW